jgi:hypothetical protein
LRRIVCLRERWFNGDTRGAYFSDLFPWLPCGLLALYHHMLAQNAPMMSVDASSCRQATGYVQSSVLEVGLQPASRGQPDRTQFAGQRWANRNIQVILPETAMASRGEPHFGRILNIEMLAFPGGRERTEQSSAICSHRFAEVAFKV